METLRKIYKLLKKNQRSCAESKWMRMQAPSLFKRTSVQCSGAENIKHEARGTGCLMAKKDMCWACLWIWSGRRLPVQCRGIATIEPSLKYHLIAFIMFGMISETNSMSKNTEKRFSGVKRKTTMKKYMEDHYWSNAHYSEETAKTD